MRLTVLIFSIFVLSSAAEATQFSQCATYLLSARANHFNDSISEQYTAEAFQALSAFRTNQLKQFDIPLSNTPAIARENSPDAEHRAVAARLATLFSDRRIISSGSADGHPLREKIYGKITEGADLDVELANRGEFRRAAESLPRVQLEKVTSTVFGALYVASMTATTAIVGSSESPFAMTAWAAIFLATRHLPEETIRFLNDSLRSPNDDLTLRTVLNTLPATNGWYYRSFDVRIPLDVVDRIWRTNEASEYDFEKYLENAAAARTTFSLTSDRLIPNILRRDVDPSDGWMRVDELLRFNSDFQPQLITFVRVAEKLPAYPKTSTVRQRARAAAEPAIEYLGAKK